MKIPQLMFLCLIFCAGAHGAAHTVRVATVHFEPVEGDVPHNRQELIRLTRQAAQNGAKIVVHTEMATSGYSYFSRAQIAAVAEPIPGPSTRALAAVAKQYQIYVALGLPEIDRRTKLYYNSVALLGPDGQVVGVYRKRNNLLEASYNSEVWSSVPVFDTPYGRVAIVICADLFYSGFPRSAALKGVNILLAPANVGISTDFMKVRTWENDFSLVVANRFGKGSAGSKPKFFNQDSFSIPSPFAYTFTDTRSAVVSNTQQVLVDISEPRTQIGYADILIRHGRTLPVVRRPSMYPLLAQDTLEPYTFSQQGLPAPTTFGVAAVNPESQGDPWSGAAVAVQNALAAAKAKLLNLRLIVLPSNYLKEPTADGMATLKALSTNSNVDIVVQFGATTPPRSVMIASNGDTYEYRRTHRLRAEAIPDEKLASQFWIVDRDYARVALLQDVDLMVPETSLMMEKMGVDVVAMNSDTTLPIASALWVVRASDYYNIVSANRRGVDGIYFGGYPPGDPSVEGSGLAMAEINTKYVRSKKESRFLDFDVLLRPCGPDNC